MDMWNEIYQFKYRGIWAGSKGYELNEAIQTMDISWQDSGLVVLLYCLWTCEVKQLIQVLELRISQPTIR
jgi:hypothetical protein